MNKLLSVFAFCIVGTLAVNAGDDNSVETVCLKLQGLQQHNINQYIDEMAKPKSKILTPEVEEKLACALACIYIEEKPNRDLSSFHNLTMRAISIDDATEEKKVELVNIANNCKTRVGEDLCKYLNCLKVTKEPFAGILYIPSSA